MKLPEICIKRPVFTIVLSLIIVALGAIFFTRLDIRGTPNIDYPMVTVSASYNGADAYYMEQQITTRIEKALKTVKNLDFITSTSSVGDSMIMLFFKLDTDIEVALNDVRSKISDLSNIFPDDMKAPSISKANSDGWPSLWLSITSDRHDELELTRITTEQIKAALDRLPTVGNSMLYGASYYSMRIKPDVKKMYQHKVSPMEIEQAIRAQNKNYPAGKIKTEVKEFTLKLNATLKDPKEFEQIIIKKYDNGSLLRLGDVADVVLEPKDEEVILRYNGKRSMCIGLIKQSGANVIKLSDSVSAEIERIKKIIPAGIKIEVAYDGATAVKASIQSVFFTIFEAIILVGVVTYLFLGSFRITLIPLVTIPISLIGTYSLMYFMNFSINTFTLLAMILAIGLVVDDAIVMLENIFRHVHELGKKPMQAAVDASSEISFAVVAMTVTLASVFLPVGFIEGFLGKLFVEFAWTLAFCVLISGVIALTLTPMMSSRMIGAINEENKSPFLEKFEELLFKTQESYLKTLHLAIENKKKFSLICLGSVVIMVISFMGVDKTFIPQEDDGFLQISYTGPEGASAKRSEETVIQAEEILSHHKDVLGNLQIVGWGGGDNAFAFVPLKDWSKRDKSAKDIQNELNVKFSQLPGMTIFAFAPPSLGGGRGGSDKAIDFTLQTSLEYQEFDKLSQEFVSKMQENPIFVNVERNFKSSTPTLDVIVNRAKAYQYNVDVETIARTIQYLIAGRQVGDFMMGNEIYDVNVIFDQNDRNSISSLKKIMVKTKEEQVLPLEVVTDIIEKISVKEYTHFNNAKSIGINADLAEGRTLAEADEVLEQMATKVLDANTTKLEYNGQLKDMKESNKGSLYTFLFALLFIFLVLSAQFESFGDPLLILLAVPFSITGGVVALLLLNNSINMYSNIGLITLIGLVTKNSIMLVEFSNQLRESGMKVKDAIFESAKLRLRPILMTSIATIVGAVPLVLATGAGAEARNSIGIVIVGGMLLGTIFTIFVIPVLYHTFKKDKV